MENLRGPIYSISRGPRKETPSPSDSASRFRSRARVGGPGTWYLFPPGCCGPIRDLEWLSAGALARCGGPGTWGIPSPSRGMRMGRRSLGPILRRGMGGGRGGTNRSDMGLNLSGSWQQGHSATYNTPSRT